MSSCVAGDVAGLNCLSKEEFSPTDSRKRAISILNFIMFDLSRALFDKGRIMSFNLHLMIEKLYAPFTILQASTKLNVGSEARIRFI